MTTSRIPSTATTRTSVATFFRPARDMDTMSTLDLFGDAPVAKPAPATHVDLVQRTIVTRHRTHGTERQVGTADVTEVVLATFTLAEVQHLISTGVTALVDALR